MTSCIHHGLGICTLTKPSARAIKNRLEVWPHHRKLVGIFIPGDLTVCLAYSLRTVDDLSMIIILPQSECTVYVGN